MADHAFFFTLHAVGRQLAAMPNDFYFIRLIHRATRRPCPGERLWDAGQLARGCVLRFLRARNLQGFDVYFWPYAEHGNAGYILLDLDHAAPDVIPRMRANGHEPCVLLETSPGHLQVWIRVSPCAFLCLCVRAGAGLAARPCVSCVWALCFWAQPGRRPVLGLLSG